MWKRLMLAIAALAVTAGCIQKETTQTIYLEPDGSLSWSVLERHVRSDAGTREERAREEEDYISRFDREKHPVALAFLSLLPSSMESRLLRAEPPYTLMTTARFRDFGRVFQGILDGTGIPGRAWMEEIEGGERLVVTIPLDADGRIVQPAGEEEEEEGTLLPLLEDYTEWEILAVGGKFLEAEGFEISQDGARARLPEIEDEDEARAGAEEIRLVLAWTATE